MTPACAACAERDKNLYVRDNFVSDVDCTLGMQLVRPSVYACPACGQRYLRLTEEASFFHDYNEHHFQKLPQETVAVTRCPRCGSTDAGVDEARSRAELAFMRCQACGFGELADPHEREDDWTQRVTLYKGDPMPAVVPVAARGLGCARCAGDDAELAWAASQTQRLSSFVQESHFGVHLSRCACGQAFLTVFTERIDWKGGEDDQTWLVLPIAPGEQADVARDPLVAAVSLGAQRRFLVRSFPTDGALSCAWRLGGFAIGPHD